MPKYVILSRGRAQIGTTWNIFQNAVVFINRDERSIYEKHVHNPIICHEKICKTSSEARNSILDYYGNGTEIMMLDDDIRQLGRFTLEGGKPKSVKLSPSDFLPHLENGFTLLRQNNQTLFGVAPNNNPLNFQASQVKRNVFINGPMMGMVVSNIRFDTHCVNKSDYDFTLQHIAAGLGVFRLDYLWQQNDYNKMEGGTRAYRTREGEQKTYEYLLRKWPLNLKPNPKRELEFILRVGKEGVICVE